MPHLDDVCRAENARLNAHFGVTPRFGFFDDSAAPNAYAAEATGTSPAAVFFGITLLKNIAGPASTLDPLPIVGIMAHEWAHILQFEKKVTVHWDVRIELSADYLAGWYLAKTRASDPGLLADLKDMFSGLGDTSFTDIDHHGTPKQRASMMMRGAGAFRFHDGRVPDGLSTLALDATAAEALTSALRILK